MRDWAPAAHCVLNESKLLAEDTPGTGGATPICDIVLATSHDSSKAKQTSRRLPTSTAFTIGHKGSKSRRTVLPAAHLWVVRVSKGRSVRQAWVPYLTMHRDR
jgi:hypothetical protein